MITKLARNNNDQLFDLKVSDINNNSFIMTVGGNYDLYWLPEDYEKAKSFEIHNSDKLTFSMFEQLFNAIKLNDDPYHPTIKGNTITFVSEECVEEESNYLEITKEKESFIINFVRNENANFMNFRKGGSVCFCNSGSRVPDVEILFMKMFNFLAYNSDLIQFNEETIM